MLENIGKPKMPRWVTSVNETKELQLSKKTTELLLMQTSWLIWS